MNTFNTHQGIVAPLDRSNVDTDAILPKQFLKSIRRTGFGDYLFDSWRYLDIGQPDQDCSNRPINPDFVLNESRYRYASILLTRANFGCGSSREHAPWALADYGFKVIIAPSFAEIFYNNCFKNGILPIILEERIIDDLFVAVENIDGFMLEVDLSLQEIVWPDACRALKFDIDKARKDRLMNGLDDIAWTLSFSQEIKDYEKQRFNEEFWVL